MSTHSLRHDRAGPHETLIASMGVDSDVLAALAALYKNTPAAKTLAAAVKGILVFPNIVKAASHRVPPTWPARSPCARLRQAP